MKVLRKIILMVMISLILRQHLLFLDKKREILRRMRYVKLSQLRRESNILISYDDLSRELIRSGRLEELIHMGVAKVTSNPSIFLAALLSGFYDADIIKLAREGKNPQEIYDLLYRGDVVEASKILYPFYISDSNNYFVSIETNPTMVHDREATLKEAKILNSLAPNIDVKIACVDEGIAVIEDAIAEGIDVNATLLFPDVLLFREKSQLPQHYKKYIEHAITIDGFICIAPQFMELLEAIEKGYERFFQSKADASDIPLIVLSEFLSRVDTASGAVDEQLENLFRQGKITEADYQNLKGKTAVDAIKIINRILAKKLKESVIFSKLEERGISLPRLLLASTKPKKHYIPSLQYVETLQSTPDQGEIIITVPEETFEKILREGKIIPGTIDANLEISVRRLYLLQSLGIRLDKIRERLVKAGVEAFAEDYKKAIEYISKIIKEN